MVMQCGEQRETQVCCVVSPRLRHKAAKKKCRSLGRLDSQLRQIADSTTLEQPATAPATTHAQQRKEGATIKTEAII
eukprot:scaffold581_cov127-Skeletonema_marinoi.AAC.20